MSPPPHASPLEAFPSGTTVDEDDDDEIHDAAFARRGCCFCLPNLFTKKHPRDHGGGGSSAAFWQRIRPTTDSPPWWRRGWKKVSGLSEVGDGPKWKTLIRRFNNRRKRRGYGKFHYDATSYALNFDDGPFESGDYYYSDEDLHCRGFSDRYSLPPSAKSSMDFENDLNFR